MKQSICKRINRHRSKKEREEREEREEKLPIDSRTEEISATNRLFDRPRSIVMNKLTAIE